MYWTELGEHCGNNSPPRRFDLVIRPTREEVCTVASMYRGMLVMIYRDVPTFGLYTLVYTYLYKFFMRHEITDRKGIFANLMAGGTAGVCGWILIIPFDVVKSLVQADTSHTKYSGMWDCIVKTYRTCGLRAFWTGLPIVCARAFPVNAVTFLIYSKCLLFLNSNVTWGVNVNG